jgi:hypothetical protein
MGGILKPQKLRNQQGVFKEKNDRREKEKKVAASIHP